MVELRSPDLWEMQENVEFYARFAHEGPEAAQVQFRGGKRDQNQTLEKIVPPPSPGFA